MSSSSHNLIERFGIGWLLAIILAGYVLLGVLYATQTPAWQVPDEPAHYNYIRYVAERGRLPILEQGDFPAEYLEEIKAQRFPPEMSIAPIRYESHQPPLYYVMGAGVYRLARVLGCTRPLLPLRLFSLSLGVLALWLGFKVLRTAFPSQPWLALGGVGFAASLPMHLAISAGVNNDVLVELLLALIAWRLLRRGDAGWSLEASIRIGLLLGLAFLTKLQSYLAFGMALFLLVWDCRYRRREPWGDVIRWAGAMLGMALIVALPWLIRNVCVYGLTDPLALARHDQVAGAQLTTREMLAQRGFMATLGSFTRTTFHSFWGQFGWMGVPLSGRAYQALLLLSLYALLGLVAYLRRWLLERWDVAPPTWRSIALLAVWVAMTTLGYLWYNTKYVQHQGRYLFPAILPLGLGFVMGLRELVRSSPWLHLLPSGAAIGILLFVGLLQADLYGYRMLILVAGSVGLIFMRWLEERIEGASIMCAWAAMSLFALNCLRSYILPALTP